MNRIPHVVIVGAGVEGLAVLERVRRRLHRRKVAVTVVDHRDRATHPSALVHAVDRSPDWIGQRAQYAPGYVVCRLGAEWVHDTAVAVDPERRRLLLATRPPLEWDYLVMACGAEWDWQGVLGASPRVNSFATAASARLLASHHRHWSGGTYVLATMGSIKPGAAAAVSDLLTASAALLWDASLRRSGRRKATDLLIATPWAQLGVHAGGAAAERLHALCQHRGIAVLTRAPVSRVGGKTIETANAVVDFDLLVVLPPREGAPLAARSGLAGRAGWIAVNANGQHQSFSRIYAVGDICADLRPKRGERIWDRAERVADHLAVRLGSPARSRVGVDASQLVETGFGRGLYASSEGCVHNLMAGWLARIERQMAVNR